MGDDALSLERLDDDTWRVFYSERGSRGREWSFESENEACMFLARKLIPQNFDRFILIADDDLADADTKFEGWLTANAITFADLAENELVVEEASHRKRYFVHGLAILRLAHPWLSFDGCTVPERTECC